MTDKSNRELSSRTGANSPVRASPIYSDKQVEADINWGVGRGGAGRLESQTKQSKVVVMLA